MSRRGPPEDVYQDDSLYEDIDRRRRSRDDRYFDPELGARRRRGARSPPAVREIEERVRVRPRDRSAPDFVRESFRPPRDEIAFPPRLRDRPRPDDLALQREMEEVYVRRRAPSIPRQRPRRVSRDEIVEREIDEFSKRPREKEEIIFEERREPSPPPREKVEREEIVFRKRDRSLPPRRAREDEDIIIEKDRRRIGSPDRESIDEEKVSFRRRERPPRREDDFERERISRHRRSLPPLDDYRTEEDDLVFIQKDRLSGRERRRGERPLPEEDEREEIIFRERDRSPHGRRMREEVVVRREDRSPPRRRRGEEVDDVLIRRSRSIPAREEDREEIVFKHKDRSSRPRDDDREEIIIRDRNRSVPAPDEDDREEVRVSRHHRSSRAKNDDRDDISLRRRSVHSLDDDDREEIIIRKDKHGRRRSLGPEVEEKELIIRDDEGDRRDRIEFRHVHSPRHSPVRSRSRPAADKKKEEIIIRENDRDGRRGNREIIIRKDEEQSSSSSESSPEPPIVRKPPILQEVITHHRHIDSYETIPPRRESPALTDSVGEIEIKRKGERNGQRYAEEIIIDRQGKEKSISPPPRRHSPPEEDEELIITRTKSGDHGRERELIIRDRERREEVDAYSEPKEEVRIRKRYTEPRRKREKVWTEISKDLVVREALERAGFEYEESDDFYYVFEYLRYDDVEKLVDFSEDIQRARRERVREIRRERETLPPLPVIPGPPPIVPRAPLLLERAPAREPYPWEERERYRESEVIIEGDRRPRRYRDV